MQKTPGETMIEQHISTIARELQLSLHQVRSAAQLLEEGATIPFIARYRKEATGSLDEAAVASIRDRLAQLDAMDRRKATVLKSIEDQGKLTEDLREKILGAQLPGELEDIYLPFRPKRRTRASIARERGLEPLAVLLFAQDATLDPRREAKPFLDSEKGITSEDEALAGARDIIAEWINENAAARTGLRTLFTGSGIIRSRVLAEKEKESIQYRDYYDWQEPVAAAPSHRILAARRGEKEGFLTVHVEPAKEDALLLLRTLFLRGDSPASQQVENALHDSYKRLLAPSLETETMQWAKGRADTEAIQVFADNLRHLLMAPPFGSRRVMAVDPGFRTGCKLVCLDPQGKLLHHETIHPHSGTQSSAAAGARIRTLVADFQVEAVAIGNGTAGRETESFIRSLRLSENIQVIMVDESGASIYSASDIAREEFPNHDVTIRGSISIGRRLMDPLAELVKIDPKSIGVGQYQHDVDQTELRKSLDDVVTSCVNAVGVEVNTASPQLLARVSGIGPRLARNIIAWRDENGPFSSRDALKKVPRFGPKAFQQAAGFLRLRNAENPLDASAVHPESYAIVEKMARDQNCTVMDLMSKASLRDRIDPSLYVTEEALLPTLLDILAELAKPGRDPREQFDSFSFAQGVEKPSDLVPGMRLPGIVTNVTAFGAFVDIGVHRDGLVHVSELSDHFVKDPREVVRVHQRVNVTVLEVDMERKRISLSMKLSADSRRTPATGEPLSSPPSRNRKPSEKKTVFNNPFETALKNRK